MSHRVFGAAFLIMAVSVSAQAATIISANFDDITNLPGAGWVMTNNSNPLGTSGWFQGNTSVFTSQTGADDSYIAADFNNAFFGGNISNWLITPAVTLDNGQILTFYTRTETAAPAPDSLEVRLSTNGASSNVGATDSSVGDFTTLLLSINGSQTLGGYPEDWTLYSVTLSGLGGPTSGRLALRYDVTDTSTNGDYIGIDTLSLDTAAQTVPEPGTGFLIALALAGALLPRTIRRYRNQ